MKQVLKKAAEREKLINAKKKLLFNMQLLQVMGSLKSIVSSINNVIN
jgi:ribosomal protein L29